MDKSASASQERVEHQAVQPLETKQYRANGDQWGHEAAPLWCAKLLVPRRGWGVASNIDYLRDLGEVREVIGA